MGTVYNTSFNSPLSLILVLYFTYYLIAFSSDVKGNEKVLRELLSLFSAIRREALSKASWFD